MKTTNIDQDDKMTITQANRPIAFTSFRFSGGETQFKLTDHVEAATPVALTCRIRSGDDVMELLLAVDALKRLGVSSELISLKLPYLPYARQDRVMVTGEAFSLKVFAQLINSLQLGRVEVFDPHSDVGPALIDRCEVRDNLSCATAYIQSQVLPTPFVLISPDAGAYKKTSKLAEKLQAEVVVATKSRNVSDGKLAAPQVLGDVSGRACVIVDDICDGGRTFINLAEALQAAGASECHLFVSHGIFSTGYDTLLSRFKTIGTTDSFKPASEFPDSIQIITL